MLTELLRHTDPADTALAHRALQLALAAPPAAMCRALPVMLSTAADVAGSWNALLPHAAADVAARCLQTLSKASGDVAAACRPLLAQSLHAIGGDRGSGPYHALLQHVGVVLGDVGLLESLVELVGHADADVQHRALRTIAAKV